MSYGKGRYFVYMKNVRVKVQEEPSGRWLAHYARTGNDSKRAVHGQVFGPTRKDLFRKMRIEISAHMSPGVHEKVVATALRGESYLREIRLHAPQNPGNGEGQERPKIEENRKPQ